MTNKELAQSLEAVAGMIEWDYPINYAGDLLEAAKRLQVQQMTDKYFGTICVCAVRYSIGRYTYMPELVQNFIKRNIALIDKNSIAVMIMDIESTEKFGMEYDRKGWMAFLSFLKGVQKCEEGKTEI